MDVTHVGEEAQIVAPVSRGTMTAAVNAAILEVNTSDPTAATVATIQKTVATKGTRSAASSVDLSGDWAMIDSEEFKQEYDEYLRRLGQPIIVRGIALGIIGLTTESTEQRDQGRELFIRGTNARGVWERTLCSSTAEEPLEIDVVTADAEIVKAEAWWEDDGKVHVSWMRGVSKYGGGDFASRRFLEQGGKVLVCETVFHPNDVTREKAKVTWKFLRKGEKL